METRIVYSSDVAFTPSVKAVQARKGSRNARRSNSCVRKQEGVCKVLHGTLSWKTFTIFRSANGRYWP